MSDLDAILSHSSDDSSDAHVETEAPKEEKAVPVNEGSSPVVEDESDDVDEGSDPNRQVPVAALQAERKKAQKRYTEQVAEFQANFEKKFAEQEQRWSQRFEQMMQAFQPARPQQTPDQPKKDFWEDPEAVINDRVEQAVGQVAKQVREQRETFSKMQAIEKHGEEKVSAAFKALSEMVQADPVGVRSDYDKIMASPHPYDALVSWHGRRQALSEIGDDPAAYREKVKAEVLAELQKNGGVLAPPTDKVGNKKMPSDFTGGANRGARRGPEWSGAESLEDIFDRARKP